MVKRTAESRSIMKVVIQDIAVIALAIMIFIMCLWLHYKKLLTTLITFMIVSVAMLITVTGVYDLIMR